CFAFFFNDTATTEIYTTRHTLSLHDALPISHGRRVTDAGHLVDDVLDVRGRSEEHTSELQSRLVISYAVFCLKKKKEHTEQTRWCANLQAAPTGVKKAKQ